MARLKNLGWFGLALVAAVACSDDEGDCPVADQNAWIKETMLEWHLENDQVPDLDPLGYSSAQAFLTALREDIDLAPGELVAPDRFSVVSSIERERASVDSSNSGFGLLMEVQDLDDGTPVFRMLDVIGSLSETDNPSPASRAGLVRGDAIASYDGRPLAEVFNVDGLRGFRFPFGLPEGERHELGIVKADGSRTTVALTTEVVSRSSVPLFKVFEQGDEKVGYFFFRRFDFVAVEQLRRAFVLFAEQNVTKLIIDQRYNLGGFVFVVDYLADLLVGNDLGDSDTVFLVERWNDDKPNNGRRATFSAPVCPPRFQQIEREQEFDCQGPVNGLSGLEQIVFINSGNTASASELILSGMQPHVDVTIVGSRSVGKPVGSAPFPGFSTGETDFCGLVLRPITFRNENANGEGDYYDGFVPDCPAADDATGALGSEDEASIATALNYLAQGSCGAAGKPGGLTAEVGRGPMDADADDSYGYANSLARLRDAGAW